MFMFKNSVKVRIGNNLSENLIKELMTNFTYTVCDVDVEVIEKENVIYIENGEEIELLDNDYGYNATNSGIFFIGKNINYVMYVFLGVIDKFRMKRDQSLYLEDKYLEKTLKKAYLQFRSLHICVGGTSDLYLFEKSIRFAAFLGYSHLIIELGSVNFDTMKELHWNDSYLTKESIKKLIKLARELGMEVIPGRNMIGHASYASVLNAKHLVLDQNPKLAYLFSPSGWEWDITEPEVFDITVGVIDEILEIFGECRYFHFCVDETFTYEETEESIKILADFINRVAKHLLDKGIRPMMWGDMLLLHEKYSGQPYFANGSNKDCEGMLADLLDKRIIIVDWQYRVLTSPWNTSKYLKEKGFEVVCCSWKHTFENVDSAIDTVKNEGLFGFMQSTWNPPYGNIETYIRVIHGGLRSMDYDSIKTNMNDVAYTLKLVSPAIRKLMPSPSFEKSGFPI